MTVSPHRGRRRPSPVWTLLHSCLLLGCALVLLGPRLAAQALTPGGPVDFGSLPVNTGNTSLTLVFNASTSTLVSAIDATTAGAPSADFQVVYQTCKGLQAPPASCIITVSFAPTAIGLRRGALSITDGSGATVNRVFLHGIGLGPQIVLAPAATSLVDLGVTGLKPSSSALDGNGNLFFIDISSNTMFERTPAGITTALASTPITSLSSVAVSGAGIAYLSSPDTAQVLAIAPGSTTLAPVPTGGITLVRPAGIAIDGSGYLYIADAGTNSIVRIDLSTVGIPGTGVAAVSLTLSGLSSPLFSPAGLAVDAANNLYIADSGNDRIVKLSLLTGKASAVALSNLFLSNPYGVTVDPAGTLTVADTGNRRLIVIPASGSPFLLGTPGATLGTPGSLMLQPNGDILISDSTAGMLLVSRSSLSLSFPTSTKVGTPDSTDGTVSATFQNSGNLPLQLTAPGSGNNPRITTGAFAVDGSSTCPVVTSASAPGAANQLALGSVCTYAVTFQPTNTGLNTAQIILGAAPIAGGVALSPAVDLSGTGFSTLDHFTVVASPSLTTAGSPVTLTVTAFTNTGDVATDYLGTITFTATDATAKFPVGFTYTFTAGDAGAHVFTAPAGVVFNTVGTFTVSVADNAITGRSNPVTVVNTPTVILSSSVDPVAPGGGTVLSVTVGSVAAIPTGTVTFLDGNMPLGTVTLVNGAATLPASFALIGNHTLTATYSGDTAFVPGLSNTVIEAVQQLTPAVTLKSSTNPVLPGGSTVLSVAVTSQAGNQFTATGTVTFLDGGKPLGTVTLINGVATLPTSFTLVGNHTLTATYSGDTVFVPGLSNTVVETVQDLTPVIALHTSANPILLGNAAVLSVAVASPAGNTTVSPTGTVTFLDGSTPLGTAALVNGVASLTPTFTATGGHPISVSYSGDGNFAPGISNLITETVEDFSIVIGTTGGGSASANPGSPAGFSLLVSPLGGSTFAAGVTYTVSGLPAAATSSFSPASIAAGATSTPLLLSVTPAADHVARLEFQPGLHRGRTSAGPIAFALLLAPLAFFRRRGRLVSTLCLLLVASAATLGLTGCLSDSASGYYAPTPKTYPLTIMATSGQLSHAVSVSLTVE